MKTHTHRIVFCFLVCLIASIAARPQETSSVAEPRTAPAPANPSAAKNLSPMVLRLRHLYKHVWEGNRNDFITNDQLAKRFRALAARHEARARQDRTAAAEHARSVRLAERFESLTEQNRIILLAFEGRGIDPLRLQTAMLEIPKIEQEITALSGRTLERKWLTLTEVHANRDKGLKFRTRETGVLPHSKEDWYDPEEDMRNRQPRQR